MYSQHTPTTQTTRADRRAGGFSLVEVILALGIMGLAIVSILGLIGPTLSNVKKAEDINSATMCIEKMNAIIETAPFWNSTPKLENESVYQWILDSGFDSPTTFLFYNEIPTAGGGTNQDLTPLQRVVRFNAKHTELNTPFEQLAVVTQSGGANKTNTPQLPVYEKIDDFVKAAAENRISGPVIAMTLSPSPLMKNFPSTGVAGDETQYYQDPPSAGLFPTTNGMPTDPSGASTKGAQIYAEGYLPIFVQAFSVSTENILSSEDVSSFQQQLNTSLTLSTRLFTYTTAKLR